MVNLWVPDPCNHICRGVHQRPAYSKEPVFRGKFAPHKQLFDKNMVLAGWENFLD